MRAVFRHELASYFNNLSGYVFGAFLLLFGGIYTMAYNLNNRSANFEYVFGDMSFAFLFIVPILTMRVLAEERKQKTDQLLYSLPLTMTKVVLGKYAALIVVFVIPMAVIGVYPMILSNFGSVHIGVAFGSGFAFMLLGASLIAIGMYISSVTESQAVAAGLCFVVMLINYYLASLVTFVSVTPFASCVAFAVMILLVALIVRIMTHNTFAALIVGIALEGGLAVLYMNDSSMFYGLFPKIMAELSLFEHFYGFIDGVIDLRSVVYFLTVIGVFVFLSVQSLEKRRWSE